MNEIHIKAPAKLNLHLQVVSKRDDGFHNLRTLFTYINLYDYLSFKETKKKIELQEVIPIKDNIILKAAEILKEKTYKFTVLKNWKPINSNIEDIVKIITN